MSRFGVQGRAGSSPGEWLSTPQAASQTWEPRLSLPTEPKGNLHLSPETNWLFILGLSGLTVKSLPSTSTGEPQHQHGFFSSPGSVVLQTDPHDPRAQLCPVAAAKAPAPEQSWSFVALLLLSCCSGAGGGPGLVALPVTPAPLSHRASPDKPGHLYLTAVRT